MTVPSLFLAPVTALTRPTSLQSTRLPTPSRLSTISLTATTPPPPRRKSARPRSPPPSSNSASRSRPLVFKDILAAQRFRKQGNWIAARALLDSARPRAEHDPNFLNEVLHVRAAELRATRKHLTEGTVYADLMAIVEAAPAAENATTFNAVLVGVREVGGSEALKVAERVFERMVEKRLFPDHFTMSILFGMCAEKRSMEFVKIFESRAKQTFGFQANTVSGSALLGAYAKCGELDCVEEVMEDLIARDVLLNERTWSSIISAYNRNGRHVKVLECFMAAVRSRSVKPNVFLYSGALASCCKAKDTANARRVFLLLERSKIVPTEEIIGTLFETALRGEDVKFGLEVLLEIAPRHGLMKVDVSHFNRLIAACKRQTCSAEKASDLVREVLNRMKQETSIAPDVATLNSLIATFIGHGMHSAAHQVLENDFQTFGLVPDVVTYNTLIHSLGRSGRPELAMKVLERMKSEGIEPNQITHNALLDLSLASGKDDEVAAFLSDMLQTSGTDSDAVCAFYQMKLLRCAKDPDSALSTFHNARKAGVVLDAKASGYLISTLLKNRRPDDAISVLGYLCWKQQVDTSVLNMMLDYVGHVRKDCTQSFAIFENMKRKGIAPDAVTYSTLIRTFSRNGLLDRAFRLLGEMQDVGLGMMDTFSWTSLIDGCGRVGQWQRAVELLELMQNPQSRYRQIPVPSISCYNAAIYATGMGGGGWQKIHWLYSMLKEDDNVEADVVTLSSMASGIMRNRYSITDWQVVREICTGLKKLEKESSRRRPGAHRSHAKYPKGSARNPERPMPRKIRAKMKRLQWLLAQVEEGKPLKRALKEEKRVSREQQG